jgi:hypothetical protein
MTSTLYTLALMSVPPLPSLSTHAKISKSVRLPVEQLARAAFPVALACWLVFIGRHRQTGSRASDLGVEIAVAVLEL